MDSSKDPLPKDTNSPNSTNNGNNIEKGMSTMSTVDLDESDESLGSRSDENGNPPTIDPNKNKNNNKNVIKNISQSTRQAASTQSVIFQIPIIGYEIMEERARFTIYKLRVEDPRTGLSWMVFRRYTDFVRFYSKLKASNPSMNLPLPGKRRFKDNFDSNFLDDRVRGLQLFVNTTVKNLASDPTVRDFFCLDEPPPICDSEPESLALFGALEDTVSSLKNQIRQKDETIDYLKKKIMYFEEKMKSCEICNAGYVKNTNNSDYKRSGTSGSSNCS